MREGAALLQGLVLCGQGGRRLRVRSLEDGTLPSYDGTALHVRQAGPTCQSLRGDGVDAAVARGVLDAMQPAELAVALATLAQVEAQARHIERQWHLRLERAQYAADRARRRFLAVDPENRLGARTLERDWNDTLAAPATLEREHAAVPPLTARLVSPEERQRILALAQDVPAVWAAETTSPTERKPLLRWLLKDVTLTKRATTIAVAIRWQTEAGPMLDIPRPARSCDRRRTPPTVVARIRTLAPHHTDSQMATRLNQEGAIPGLGGTFTASKVAWVRYVYASPAGCPEAPGACPNGQRGDGRYSAQAAAQMLHVAVSTRADWCRTGRLDYIQQTPHSPRWVLLTPARMAALRKPRRQRTPRRLPHACTKRILRAAADPSASPPEADNGHSQRPWVRGAVGRTHRHPERSLPSIRFGDIDPPHRLRSVAPSPQVLCKRLEKGGYPLPLDVVYLHRVEAGTSALGAHCSPGPPPHVRPEHAVVARMESALPAPLGRLVSRALEVS